MSTVTPAAEKLRRLCWRYVIDLRIAAREQRSAGDIEMAGRLLREARDQLSIALVDGPAAEMERLEAIDLASIEA